MIQTVVNWTSRLKHFLQNANWDQTDLIKQRWINEMDHQENVSATVTINMSDHTLVLNYERNLAEIGYKAGKRIKITEFDVFCQNLNSF